MNATLETRNAAADLLLRACNGRLARHESNYWDTLDQVADLLARGWCIKARMDTKANAVTIDVVRERSEG